MKFNQKNDLNKRKTILTDSFGNIEPDKSNEELDWKEFVLTDEFLRLYLHNLSIIKINI